MPLLTHSALLKALGWTLLNSLWQMGLLWLTYQLLQRIFSQAPSRFRHGLALTLLAFGALGSVVTFVAAYFFDGGAAGSLGYFLPATDNRMVPLILPYCSSLYLLVLGGLLIRYSHQYLYSRRLTRDGLSKMPAEFRVFVASTGRRMGIRPLVQIYLSALVDVPLTLGFLKPVILVPMAMMSNLNPHQVEAILIHELAHIRRKDYLLNLGVTVIGLLFFFNPFTRLLIGHLQREREHCCDEEVLQFRYDPHAYVSALLSLARQHRQGRIALAATGSGGDQLLLQRARKILQQKRTERRPGARPFILLFLTAMITILGLSSPPRQQLPPTARQAQPALAPATAEMVFIPIVNLGAPTRKQGAPAIAHHEVKNGHPERGIHQAAGDAREDLAAVRQAGPESGADDQPQVTGIFTQPATLTIIAPPVPRDNSLGKSGDEDDQPERADDLPPTENLVFVPNSSFSFQHIDTLRPEDKLTWIEESTEKEIRAQVERLQKELRVQLELLHRQEAQARTITTASQQELKRVLNQQILLQRNYLRQLDELHTRVKRATRRLTTVYI
ncbi:MAG TPA: M56 family metallopeptidase [Puia sp.]|jgi:beta-lactamase regulating signal transducer with metallopeptidase domain|nr:M56 family metallopeptidase [Puia sp.]